MEILILALAVIAVVMVIEIINLREIASKKD